MSAYTVKVYFPSEEDAKAFIEEMWIRMKNGTEVLPIDIDSEPEELE